MLVHDRRVVYDISLFFSSVGCSSLSSASRTEGGVVWLLFNRIVYLFRYMAYRQNTFFSCVFVVIFYLSGLLSPARYIELLESTVVGLGFVVQ